MCHYSRNRYKRKWRESKDCVPHGKKLTLSFRGSLGPEEKEPCVHSWQFIPLHCRKGMQQSMRWADRHQDDTPEECPSTVFRTVTLQCPFARHSDGPADFIPLGAFHRSARCTLPSNAKSREGRRENRAHQAKAQRYTTASSGYIILLGQPGTSEQRPCQTRKSFPHPTSTSVLRLSIRKKRI